MKSTFRKAAALALSVMFLFFSMPDQPTLALGDPGQGQAVFDESIPPDGPLPDSSALRAKKKAKKASHKKLATQLLQLVDLDMLPNGKTREGAIRDLAKQKMVSLGKGKAAGSARASVYIKLKKGADHRKLKALAEIDDKDPGNDLVVASVDVDKLEALANLDSVVSVQPVIPPVVYKTNTSEGFTMHRVKETLDAGGSNGAGIKIGVISDGVDHLADAIRTGDLPNSVNVIHNDLYHTVFPEYHEAGAYDEGTAMLEIVYDIAPGAELYFSDCGEDFEAFSQSIDDLIAAGCTVIVDDIGWINAPFFEDGGDGDVAHHVKELVDAGQIIYVSSAGNAAQHHYQGKFYEIYSTGYHDFSRGRDASFKQLYVTLKPGASIRVALQWDDRFGSSSNDYDLLLVDRSTMIPIWGSINTQDGNDDPIEYLDYINETKNTYNLAIYVEKYSAEQAKTLELYLYPSYGATVSTTNTVPGDSIFGHAAVPGVLTCGAIDHATPTTIEKFSSLGPVTMVDGTKRQKPDICGADGVAVTGAGSFPNHFYGTSAAAPHVAAIAALVWSQHPGLPAQRVRDRILDNAIDRGAGGYDNTYGYGLADAYNPMLYTVDFNTSGGSAVAGIRVPPNTRITEPATTRSGGTLLGWFTEPQFLTEPDPGRQWDFATDVVAGDMTLVAKWALQAYTVTFDSRGGSAVEPVANVEAGARVPMPAAPTRTGYTFAGWYKDSACAVIWKNNSGITANTTLYAKWIAAAPQNAVAASASYNSVRVTWSHSPAAPDIGGYEVWRATSSTGTYTLVATVPASTLSIINSGLSTNTAYYYKIRAYDLAGSAKIAGYFSAVTAVVRPIPAAPATIAAARTSYNSIKVTWSGVAGASGYELWRSTSANGTYALVKAVTTLTYTNTGLTTGRWYYYKVRAYRIIGSSKVYGPFSASSAAKP